MLFLVEFRVGLCLSVVSGTSMPLSPLGSGRFGKVEIGGVIAGRCLGRAVRGGEALYSPGKTSGALSEYLRIFYRSFYRPFHLIARTLH